MRKFSPVKIVRLLLATSLSLWVAGAGCILGCEGMIASAANGGSVETHHSDEGQTVVASGHACSSGEVNKSHDCCKKSSENVKPAAPTKNNVALFELSGSSSGAMNGCPLAVSRASVVAKTRDSDLNSAPASAQSILPDSNSAERTAPLSTPLRLPNRGHTYLRCCVFLI
jgi:hypothetical protein